MSLEEETTSTLDSASPPANTDPNEPKTEEDNTKQPEVVTLQEFLLRSFETLFDQNYRLHAALNDNLEKRFKDVKETIQHSEDHLKEGFLHYTRDIMQGIHEANEDLKCYVGKRDWDSIITSDMTITSIKEE